MGLAPVSAPSELQEPRYQGVKVPIETYFPARLIEMKGSSKRRSSHVQTSRRPERLEADNSITKTKGGAEHKIMFEHIAETSDRVADDIERWLKPAGE